jgi:Xaa-Pro aminopeptidase
MAEGARRSRAAAGLMTHHGLDALAVSGGGMMRWDRYLTNEANGGIVLLIAGEAPVYLVGHGNYAFTRYDAAGVAYERWVDDVRVGPPFGNLVALLRERGGRCKRVGVVGLTSRGVGQANGWIPHTAWRHVLDELPSTTFVDVSEDFEQLAVVKSSEELLLLRQAARLGEAACGAFVAAASPGRRECEPVAAALQTIVAGGGWSYMLLVRSGPELLGWTSSPEWIAMGGGSRVLEPGDFIGAELFPSYGGYESQQQIQVSLGEPSPEAREVAAIARASYDAGLAVARPGASFEELCDAMQAPLSDAGCWSLGPLVQTISPVMFNGPMYVDAAHQPALAGVPAPAMVPRDGDLVLEPGMAFAFQPNAVRGRLRVNIGGTVIITPDGNEEFNDLPNELVVVEA